MSSRRNIAGLVALLAACAEPSSGPEPGQCRVPLWAKPSRNGVEVSVRGSWDAWSSTIAMHDVEGGFKLAQVDLPPGVYGYEIVEAGQGRLDAYNPLTTFRASDAREVSRLTVHECERPRLVVQSVTPRGRDGYEVHAAFVPAADGTALDPMSIVAADEAGPLQVVSADDEGLVLRAEGRARGKYHAWIEVADETGSSGDPVRADGWADAVAPRWDDGIVYQIMIDRFLADGGAPLEPPADPGARAGGTLDGIRVALERGDFDRLAVSALWLTPVYQNPIEARDGRFDGHQYEGYHGYWPLQSRAVEPRIGGEAALHELVAAAHARGIRVLLDLVPNHLYEANPRVAQHRADGWFNEAQPTCVCGAPDCPWSQYIGTCWFTDYLPDLRLQQPDAMESVVGDATWWLSTFDVDGFRIDAVPMIPRAATRRIVAAAREEAGSSDAAFAMGEIFTGAGPDGTADIRYYMGPDGLDSAFDFPLMWALREAIATGDGGFAQVEATLAETDRALEGSGAILGRMIGNHDVTRFASEVAGDAGGDPWDAAPAQPSDDDVYARQRLALGLVLALPGVPVVYYGDEVGLAGAADPDNRRVMPSSTALSDAQVGLLADAQRIAQTRRCLPALRRGARQTLVVTDDTWAFLRDTGDGAPALVVASRAATPIDVRVPPSAALSSGVYSDIVAGDTLQVGAGPSVVALPAAGLRVFVPASHPCLVP